jgi:hypothetical protein
MTDMKLITEKAFVCHYRLASSFEALAATSCAANKFRYDSLRLQLRLSSRLALCERLSLFNDISKTLRVLAY